MANSLLKNIGHNSIADGLYKEITSRSSRLYHTFGKTSSWIGTDPTPMQVIDSKKYERAVRNEIISMKEISPSDISYVIPRVNWTSGTVYDEFDDAYSTEIIGINLVAGGSNYTAPTVTIGTVCPINTAVVLTVQYYYIYNSIGYLYTVTTAGTTGSSNVTALGAATPTIGTTYTHGTAVLTCVGFKATASVTLGTGSDATKIVGVTMTYGGYGYNSIPALTFSGGGTGVSATAVMAVTPNGTYTLEDSNYYVLNSTTGDIFVCVDNNNNSASTVIPSTVSSTIFSTADNYKWKYMASTSVNNKFLTDTHMPIITASVNQYTATGGIVSVSIDSIGSGYTSGTTINVSGDGYGAILTPTITNGAITGIVITNGGSGYTYANLTFSDTTGKGAHASPSIFLGTPNSTVQAQKETSVIVGSLVNISIVSNGYGYTTSPTVSITGDGTGATATATIANGRVTKINIINRGQNYNWATIVITGVGYGAVARAVISPYGGLGKDPVNQLCARSLMFYSKIDNDYNQGIILSSVDYRQIGIIKDPVRYRDGNYLKANFASTCWRVTAVANITGFTTDTIATVYANSTVYTFRIAYVNGTNILLIPIDNGIPVSGMQFTSSTGSTFIVSSTTPPIPPSADKYSGDLMLVDNESTFTGSSVVVRSVINF